MKNPLLGLALATLLASTAVASADDIEDNSFLIEEAYNQEPGVVQHISTVALATAGDDLWSFSFTQEWPLVSQRHQLSYSVPLVLSDAAGDEGLGDLLLNYRYEARRWASGAFAPRLSLALPTGDEERGLGSGSWGLQLNLPLSVRIADRWLLHGNAGANWIAEGTSPAQPSKTRPLLSPFVGGSIVWLARDRINFLLEGVATRLASLDDRSRVRHDESVVISPGLRWSIDRDSLQIVPGVAVPVTFESGESSAGIFLYLSFEHPY